MSLLFDEISEQPAVISKALDTNADTLKKIADDFKKMGIDSVYFAARGTSDHACIYAQYLFAVYAGMPCTLGTPSAVSKYGAKINFSDAAVIGVSQSGKAEDVLCIIRQANEQGKLTVAVTNDDTSPLAKEAKYHLYCNAGEEKSIAATKTFTSQMYLLARLCQYVSGSDELGGILDKVSEGTAKLLAYMPDTLTAFAEKYKDADNIFLLGRGMVYPIALEGALKILETNRRRVKGAAISDFYHGPIAQIGEGTLSFVLAAQGPTYDDALAMIERLDSMNADVLVLTDSEELANIRSNSLLVPYMGSDVAAPYVMAMTLQLFAYKLTEARGISPDHGNVLKKVTITK